MLNIIQKKGTPDALCGRLLVYARILPPPMPEALPGGFPWEDMVHNGLLVVLGEFKGQLSFRDFLRTEFKSDSEGLESLAQKLRDMGEDIPEGLSSEELRERLESMSQADIIPVPAKVMTYESEQDILDDEADVFFVGEFVGVLHAHLAVTSFPILYQAIFREQEARTTSTEINGLLDQVASALPALATQPSGGDPVVLQIKGTLEEFQGNLLDFLMSQVIPNLVYNLEYPAEFLLSIQSFRRFMKPYRFQNDIEELEKAMHLLHTGDLHENRHMELLCRKIAALHHEEFEKLTQIQAELSAYQKKPL